MSKSSSAFDRLAAIVAVELAQPLPTAVTEMAERLAAQGAGSAVAVLFYGSVLRTQALDGMLDFYVLVDSLRDWYRHWLPAAANHALPPSILYFEHECEGQTLRAKVAVLRVDQFQKRVRAGSLDTTMWARYCQPAAVAWARDAAARALAGAAVSRAVISAAGWAARLGPQTGRAEDYWQSLFRRTYGAELRVEKATRADTLIEFAEARYSALLPLAWVAAGIVFDTAGDTLSPNVSAADRRRAMRGWGLRRALGKPLNFVRLMKSAYTFAGGVDYLIWKVERHSGVRIELSDWQRRHPILAAPGVLLKLRRQGAIR